MLMFGGGYTFEGGGAPLAFTGEVAVIFCYFFSRCK